MDAGESELAGGEQCRLWGEEKDEESVWGVFLKKVRYQRPSSIVQLVQASGNHSLSIRGEAGQKLVINGHNGDNGEIAHLMWETVRVRVLKAGTLKRVIEAIHNEDSDVQATHLSVFLATYRAFATPAEVVREIISVYKTSDSEGLSKTMVDALNVWIDSYSEDFERGSEGYEMLQKILLPFAQEENLKSLSLKVQYKLRSRRKMKKSASIHSLRINTPLHIKTYSLLSIPEAHFAQQLTYFDKELFLNLRVWECLGGLWKRRCGCPTVAANVEQFNALSGRVVASILLDPVATIQARAKCLEKWIKISQELRHLKNFSSLKAIISALESSPVYRLSKVWHLVSKDRLAIFTQLAQIFSEENNRLAQRTLLETEGTAKFSTPTKSPKERRFFSKVLRGPHGAKLSAATENETPNGTIPYLGTFLTDLIYIDSAIPDKVHGSLINFDKRRKEFEILAQLKLLQGSAKGYRIDEDPYFTTWFNSLVMLEDKTAFNLSTTIEPERNVVKGHKKNNSFTSNSSSENIEPGLQRKGSIPSSNESSILYGATGSGGSGLGISTSNLAAQSIVVKVSSPAKGDVMYKSMLVDNADHTPKILALALEKLGLEEEDPRNYNLVQILPHKELKIPTSQNVFYALDTSVQNGEIRLEVRPNGSNNNHSNLNLSGIGKGSYSSRNSTKSN